MDITPRQIEPPEGTYRAPTFVEASLTMGLGTVFPSYIGEGRFNDNEIGEYDGTLIVVPYGYWYIKITKQRLSAKGINTILETVSNYYQTSRNIDALKKLQLVYSEFAAIRASLNSQIGEFAGHNDEQQFLLMRPPSEIGEDTTVRLKIDSINPSNIDTSIAVELMKRDLLKMTLHALGVREIESTKNGEGMTRF